MQGHLEVGAAEADAALRQLGQQAGARRRVPAPRVDAQDGAPRRLARQREHLQHMAPISLPGLWQPLCTGPDTMSVHKSAKAG